MVKNNRTETLYPMYVSSVADAKIKFYDMVGVDINDKKWDSFLPNTIE